MAKNTMKKYFITLGAFTLLCALLFLFSKPKDMEEIQTGTLTKMVPHKALYKIEMVSKSSGAQVVNISGQMFYEWKATCDAWISDHRFNLFYEYSDSPAMRITSDFSTYETFDGQSFDFNSRRERNGELYQELRGHAKIADPKNELNKSAAIYSIPEDLSFTLSEKVLFPMRHTLKVLEQIKAGKQFYSATVFDGSDEEGPVEINTFIGKPISIAADIEPSPTLDATLIETPAWKARMAFFPVIEPRSEANYEMDIVLHENGVISDMLVEYKDFSIVQRLVAIERLQDEKDCDPIQ